MNHRGRRRGRILSLAAGALLLGSVLAAGSAASFNARGANAGNVYAFTALYAPGSLTATPTGHDVGLSWTSGSNGNGYALLGVNNGNSSDCSGAAYAALAAAVGTSYTDTGRYTPQGTWFCYQARTSYGSWTSVSGNPSAAAQLGVAVALLQARNGGVAGKLDPGDTIAVTFNQPISTGSGPAGTDTLCSINGTSIVLASTTLAGSCAAGETVDLGKLTGGSSNKNARWNASYAWSNGNKTLTVTVGVQTSGTNPTVGGTWTFNPTTSSSKLLSGTGSFHTCDTNTGGGNCLATLSGGF